MSTLVLSCRIPIIFLFLLIFALGGCRDENDLTSPTCPGPRVAGLTPVENLGITDDPFLHATVTLSWSSPLPNIGDLAVESYVIKANPTGKDITEKNWCGLPLLGTFPGAGKIGFFARFDHHNDAIVPGATETFAVRPLYENGDLGPVGTVLTHRPTAPFTVEGLVRDDMTVPIAGITVRMMLPFELPESTGVVTSVETGPDGRFPPLGPISDLATIVVATDSPDTLTTPDAEDSYFDFTTEPLTAEDSQGEVTITLITRYTYEHPPGGWLAEYFIGWVQMMVYAQYDDGEYRLRKWEDYDLSVFVPEGSNTGGNIDLAAECRRAMALWNEELGLDIFRETGDITEAKLEVQFVDLRQAYGQVVLDQPQGGEYHFNGRVIPERAFVRIDPVVSENNAFGVIMHEFGHSLGVYAHSGNSNHLMSAGGGCCLGQDELRLIHTIKNLPQNCLMSNFEKGMPWPWPGPQ